MNYLLVFNPTPHINSMLTSVNTFDNEDPFFLGFVCGLFTLGIGIALIHLIFLILDSYK